MPNFSKKRKSMLQSSKRFKKRKTTSRKSTAYDKSNYLLSGTNPQNTVVFRGIGFPDRLTTNVVYADSIVLDPSVGVVVPFVVYNLASLFDPQVALEEVNRPTSTSSLSFTDDTSLMEQRLRVLSVAEPLRQQTWDHTCVVSRQVTPLHFQLPPQAV